MRYLDFSLLVLSLVLIAIGVGLYGGFEIALIVIGAILLGLVVFVKSVQAIK